MVIDRQYEKFKELKRKLQLESSNASLPYPKLRIINEIIDDITAIENQDQYHYFSDERKALIHDLKNKINSNISLFSGSALHITFCKLLVLFAKLRPLNEYIPQKGWTCPLTLEPLSSYDSDRDHKSFALTSGYLYDRVALIHWFETSKDFRDPVTRVPLPQFDIDRLSKFTNSFKQIQKNKEEYDNLVNTLITQQKNQFDRPDLSSKDQIKKDFLSLLSTYDFSSREILKSRIKENIQKLGIKQTALNNDNHTYNFSDYNLANVNLSGLCFYNNNSILENLRSADLSNSIFLNNGRFCIHETNFTDANLENTRFLNSPASFYCLKRIDFTRANLQNVQFPYDAFWHGINMTGANLTDAYLYNSKGAKISGLALKKYFSKRDVEGLDSAIFAENSNNNNNSSIQVSHVEQPKTPSLTRFGLFENKNVNNNQNQINLLQQQVQELKQQNKLLQDKQNQEIQQLQQQNILLQQQNRLFSQNLQTQQVQPQVQVLQMQPQEHRHRKHEHCIVM